MQDMMEMKDYYNIFFKRENVKKLVGFAIAPMDQGTKQSKVESLIILNLMIQNSILKQKKAD